MVVVGVAVVASRLALRSALAASRAALPSATEFCRLIKCLKTDDSIFQITRIAVTIACGIDNLQTVFACYIFKFILCHNKHFSPL